MNPNQPTLLEFTDAAHEISDKIAEGVDLEALRPALREFMVGLEMLLGEQPLQTDSGVLFQVKVLRALSHPANPYREAKWSLELSAEDFPTFVTRETFELCPEGTRFHLVRAP